MVQAHILESFDDPLLEGGVWSSLLAQSEADFRRLAQLLAQIFHFEFHALLEALEASYTDLDPDVDTRRVDFAHGNEQAPFVELLDGLLEKANYERISKADLNQALHLLSQEN